MKNLFSVAGKVALVTGGSRGIGRMIAHGLVANGARIYVTSRKAEACRETGGGALARRRVHRAARGPREAGATVRASWPSWRRRSRRSTSS